MTAGACAAGAGTGSRPEPGPAIVVANQQSASASLLEADGTTMKHLAVGAGPHEAAISADGGVAVVTIYGVAGAPGNQLAVIDIGGGSVVRTIDLGEYTRPHGAAFLGTSRDRVVVTSEATNHVVIVNLASGALRPIPTQARGSHMIAVTADGTRGWTSNVLDDSVTELDLAGGRFVRTIAVPTRPEGIAVTPDGRDVWVGSNETGAVSVIESETGRIVQTLTGTVMPYRLGVSSDGARIAIVDAMGERIVFADARTRSVTGSVAVAAPRGVAFSPDGRLAYVTLAAGHLAVIDTESFSVEGQYAVQASPDGVAVGRRPHTAARR